jgi:hypothetical protein
MKIVVAYLVIVNQFINQLFTIHMWTVGGY